MPKTLKASENNNPCGICRALGSKICRGHGGGGGGSEDSSEKDNASQKNANNTLDPMNNMNLKKNQQWISDEQDDFLIFNDPNALLNITLKMENGVLLFRSNAELSSEEKQAVQELFDAVEKEALRFNKELAQKNIQEPITITRNADTLILKISDPKYYDLFIQQLMDKNLLPSQKSSPQHQQETKPSPSDGMAQESKQSTAPTPFDISRGPKVGDV